MGPVFAAHSHLLRGGKDSKSLKPNGATHDKRCKQMTKGATNIMVTRSIEPENKSLTSKAFRLPTRTSLSPPSATSCSTAATPETQRCIDYVESLIESGSPDAGRVVDLWLWCQTATFEELARAVLHGGVA